MARTNDQTIKADAGKPRPTLLEKDCAHALFGVLATLSYGAQKYEARSWRNVGVDNYDDAARRHRILRDLDGSLSRDPESGLHHRAHEIICLLFQYELELQAELEENPGYDWYTFNKPPTDHKEKKPTDG